MIQRTQQVTVHFAMAGRIMLPAYQNGMITDERLQDALTRALGVKASLGLHKKAKTEIVPQKPILSGISLPENEAVIKEVVDICISQLTVPPCRRTAVQMRHQY
jgi:hypothetical protein